MIELLARFKSYVTQDNISDWTAGSSWTEATISNTIAGFNHISGATDSVSKDVLTINRNYILTFDVDFTTTASTNSLIAYCGTGATSSVIDSGSYTFYLTCAANSLLKFTANSSTTCDVYNIVIEEIGYTPLELFPDGDILLTLSVKEVKEYGQSTDSYSKTFTLPGTQTNNIFFKNVFNINEESLYDFNQFTHASVVVDGITIKNGIIRLDDIVQTGNYFNYNVTFFGDIIGMFSEFGETLLSDLDYSDINHYADNGDILQGWQTFAVGFNDNQYDSYVYPYICYGDQPMTGVRGNAYIPNVYFGSSNCGLLVSDLYPAISLRYLINKVLSTYGYYYSSSILDSIDFRKIILPFVNKEEKLYSWYEVANVSWSAPGNRLDGNTVAGNMNNPSTGKFYTSDQPNPYGGGGSNGYTIYTNKDSIQSSSGSVPNRENYPTVTKDEFKYWNAHHNGISYNYSYQGTTNLIPGAYRCRQTGKYRMTVRFKFSSLPTSIYLFATRIPTSAVVNCSNTIYSDTSTYEVSPGAEVVKWCGTYSTVDNVTRTVTVELDCNRDDQIAFKFVQASTPCAGYIYDLVVEEYGYGNGAFIDFKNVVPDELTVKDFMSDTLKAFNLFVKTDKDDPKKLFIENSNIFYTENKIVDLTHKVDKSQPIRISTPKDYSAKNLLFKYKETNDTFNNFYSETIDDQYYGTKKVYINDYNEEDEKLIELKIFSPTVLRNYKFTSVENSIVYSNISNYDYKTTGTITYTRNTKTTPRLLYFNNTTINNTALTFTFESLAGRDFPYAGHIKNPFNLSNTNDLNFNTKLENDIGARALMFDGVPGLYNSPNQLYITENNLYNIYWREYIENYINRNARLVELYVDLNVYDIQNIELNDVIQIDETLYHINNIIDFSCYQKGVTKMELLKIISSRDYITFDTSDITSIAPSQTINSSLYIGSDNVDTGENIVMGDNNSATNKSVVIGNNNTVTDNSVILLSDNVNSSSNNVIINSSHISIPTDISNTTVIGEEYLDINKSDATFINGFVLQNGTISRTEVMDGGCIETDGVFNPYYFYEFHTNDSGNNGNNILDIDMWDLNDCGSID